METLGIILKTVIKTITELLIENTKIGWLLILLGIVATVIYYLFKLRIL